jgi:hypothetical protein
MKRTGQPIGFRVVGVSRDRRSREQLAAYAAIEQARADMALERTFERRVADRFALILEQKLEQQNPCPPQNKR